ncbi:carbohydrate binding domain-containing protein [Phyllobacterium ifriqiyense]|uniref:carbohydrate binding domain-containing protein n=1 Tax=Phyllobacterium ifriqiyense TaxID=314238 RepID=UPI0033945BFC
MAITYPYALSVLADRLDIESVVWDIQRNDELSGSGDGRVWQAELAPPLWTGDVTVNVGYHDDIKQIAALIRKLHGAQNQFYLYDPLSKYPQAYPDGNLWPGESFSNKLINPGFETGVLTPWVPSTGVTAYNTGAHSGAYCMLMDKGATGAGAGTQREAWQLVDGIVAGKQYTLGAWFVGASPATAGANLRIQWRNAANGIISTSNIVTNAAYTTSWQYMSGTVTAPALATRALIYVVFGVTGAAQHLVVDDVSFARYETFNGSNAQIESIEPGGRRISLKGLSSGYQITLGDKLQVAYATSPVRNGFLEASESVTANSSGVTGLFEVFPNAPTGVAINNMVTLVKPACKGFIAPGSFNPGSGAGLMTSGLTFKFIEKR